VIFMSLMKNTKVLILLAFLIIGVIILGLKGLHYGLDFSGGTQFILTLSEPIEDASVMEKVQTTIAQRLDWTGLKDVKVNSWDKQFISVQIAESDPKQVAQIEALLQKQGKFETLFNNEVLFTGDEVVSVSKDPQKGYGIHKTENGQSWQIPFILSANAGRNFSEGIFHKCVSLPDGTSNCPSTFFFIDRPLNSLVLIPQNIYDEEKYTLNNIKIEEILSNAGVNYLVFETLDENSLTKINSLVNEKNISKIIYPTSFNVTLLEDANYGVELYEVAKRDLPWVWSATGLKTVISLTETITNKNAPSVDAPNFNVYMNLIIQGSSPTLEEAQKEVNELSAILSSGSLPVGIENISKESISPVLGQNILGKILVVGILALLVVALIIFLRYRDWRVALPIFGTGLAEVFLILAFASLINWQLDLAALAGILAAVGTGVDDQLIITDELERNRKEDKEERSLLSRVKRAFFIIWMSAATLAVTMLPVVFIFGGITKLVGFAIITLSGAAIGVFITRPAYAAILKAIIQK